MEMFDIRTPEGEPTGEVKERSAVHRDGDWHGTAHIWLVRRKNGKIEVLLQKRSRLKKHSRDVTMLPVPAIYPQGTALSRERCGNCRKNWGWKQRKKTCFLGEFIPVRWMTGLEGSIFWTGKSLRFIYMISLLRKRN